MQTVTKASEEARALYHHIWSVVGQTFFDTSRMKNWAAFEHSFDDQLVDRESALRAIDEMLASLNDTYTERVIEEVQAPAVDATESEAASDSTKVEEDSGVLGVLRPDGIGYLRILSFDRPDVFAEVADAINKIAACESVVVDLRNNSGGRMHEAMALCGFFVINGVIATTQMRHEDGGIVSRQYAINDTQFFATVTQPNGDVTIEMYERPAALLAGKPLVILINKRTASASELMVAALVQNGIEGRVLMVGNGPTPGKGIGQAEYELFNGALKIRVTRTRWLTPGGEWLGDCGQTVKNGIEPDITVPGDRGIEAIQAAFREIRKMLEANTPVASAS